MKIAAFQFKISPNIEENYNKIKNAVINASKDKIRLFITQECALTGYPPIEIDSIKSIDFEIVKESIKKLIQLSNELDIYIALGTITNNGDQYLNSMVMISPNGKIDSYNKRALWGYDSKNFIHGTNNNIIWEIDNVKIGIRICFEIRFPEYFRELYKQDVDIVVVSFCDISDEPNNDRLKIIESHLLTRAIENAYTIISVWGLLSMVDKLVLIKLPPSSLIFSLPIPQVQHYPERNVA